MAHQIDFSNNRANMAFTGETPWHGLGQSLPDNANLDQWRVAAGMNWDIEARAVFHGIIVNGEKKAQTIKGKKALVRSDNQECLSIMSDNYKIVQPGEVLEFYRSLVEASDMFSLETAGCLFDGRKFWALARANTELRLMGQDLILPYLLLATSCDGSMATTAQFTSVRVVCNNTLSLSVAQDKQHAIKVPHSTTFNPDQVKAELGLINGEFAEFADKADVLANTNITNKQVLEILTEIYAPKVAEGKEEISTRNANKLAKILNLFVNGPGAEFRSARNTAWGLVNAVTRFEDFESGARSDNNRFNSGQFGSGANNKAAAFAKALEFASKAA